MTRPTELNHNGCSSSF